MSSDRIFGACSSLSIGPVVPPSSVPDDATLKKHHVPGEKEFVNPWPSWQPFHFVSTITKVMFNRLIKGNLSGPAANPPALPVVEPQFLPTRSTASSVLRATWLGHACYYVEFPGGLRVLFDPVFSERASPVQWMGPKRFTPAPCKISDIPVVDLVVISSGHNHHDHLDENTIQDLKKHHPDAWYFVPLKNKNWFTGMNITRCTELDWWEEREVEFALNAREKDSEEPLAGSAVMSAIVGCLPSQHASNRCFSLDRNATLWASWSIESGGKKVYFAGDTGYRAVPEVPAGKDDYSEEYKDLPTCPAFRDIGRLRGPFSLGLLPIGAYNPRWGMSTFHADPYDSVNIFKDTQCKRALAMHWGTFVLTEEPILEPPQLLREALKKAGIPETGVFDVPDCGESRAF